MHGNVRDRFVLRSNDRSHCNLHHHCKGQKGGGMMDIVMGFIIGTFAGSIVVTFTLCLFFVNAKRRDE